VDFPQLNDAHMAEVIEQSAVLPEVAAARGYMTMTGTAEEDATLERDGFTPYTRGREGLYPLLYVPMHRRNGELAGVQIKPATPLLRMRVDGSPVPRKYETPKGAPLCIDVPAFTRAKLDAEDGPEETPLWVTEGMKKVDSLVSQGCAALGVSGVYNWRQGTGVLGDWEEIPLKGRVMVLCFDADASSNRNVQQAMKRLGAWLCSRGAKEVKYIVVPAEVAGVPVKGVDDFFAAGGDTATLAAAATATAPGAVAADASFTDAFLVEEAADEALSGKYCWSAGLGWMAWTGKVWREVSDVEPVEAIRQWASNRYDGALAAQAADKAANLTGKISGWRGVLSKSRLRALLDLSRGVDSVQRRAEDFDADPDLLTALNGTVHLPTGALRPFSPDDLMTKIAGAEYRPGYTHPMWDKALTALPDGVHDWYQDRIGQAATGYPVADHQLVIAHGSGENGKSTIVNAVYGALGGYGVVISDRVLMASPDAHPTELMDLRGARYAVLEETPEERHLNTQRIKTTLGTEMITARRIRQDTVSFATTHSLFINTNHRPIVTETDHGTWRRLCLLSFPYTFRKPGKALTLATDRQGDPSLQYAHHNPDVRAAALSWMVAGAVKWYARDRQMMENPPEIERSTREWRAETDQIIGFSDECLVFNPEDFTQSSVMLTAFNTWAGDAGHRPWNDKTFASRFGGHEAIKGRKVTTGRKSAGGRQVRGWFGAAINRGNGQGPAGGGSPFEGPSEPDADPEPDHFRDSAEVIKGFVPFDIETGSADDLFSAPVGEYVKLVGVGDRVVTASPPDLMTVTRGMKALPLVGVNNFFFDSIAMDWHHGVPVEETIIGGRDLRIAAFQNDPPTSYETASGPGFKRYSMDALSERYLGRPGKSGLGEALAKEFGGWDHIPASDPRYVEYLREDLKVTAELDAAIPWDPYEAREARVCAITARTTLNGFKVDLPALQGRVQEDAERSAAGKLMLSQEYGFPLTTKGGGESAAPQRTEAGKKAFEAALSGLGFPVASWPRGKDGSLSLKKETMAYALAHAEKNVPAAVPVIEAVQGMNGLRTTAASLLGNVIVDRVHYTFEPFQTTGRWSCGLTVLKKGVPDSERYYLLPEDEEVLVSIDLDQIDIRAVAAHSQDPNLIALLNDPTRDFHQEIADRTGVDRKPAKTLDLGWLYGRGMRGMVENTAGVTMEAAQNLDSYMRAEFSKVVEWQNRVRALGEEGTLIDNGFGRKLRVDPDRAYTQAPAMYGQSTTRDLIAEGLLTLAATAPEILPMLRVIVHDEVVLSVPRKDREEVARTVQSAMSRMWAPAGASIPVSITAGQGKPFVFGTTWGALYEK